MKTTETKNKGECVCGRGSAQRKAFRKPAQVHMVTSTEVHGPHEKRPFLPPVCQGVLCIATPGNQILGRPHTAHSSGAGGSPRGMPTLCVTPPLAALSTPRGARSLVSLSVVSGAGGVKKLVCSGARLPSVTSWLPQLGNYLTAQCGVLPW